jgi:hypothetical protein
VYSEWTDRGLFLWVVLFISNAFTGCIVKQSLVENASCEKKVVDIGYNFTRAPVMQRRYY